MGIWLLTNTVGLGATSLTASVGSVLSGYDIQDSIAGPRNRTVRASGVASVGLPGTATHRLTYSCPEVQPTHVVISRMDLFRYPMSSVGSLVTLSSGESLSTLVQQVTTGMEMIGPKQQDWAAAIPNNPFATSSRFDVEFLRSSESVDVASMEYEYGKIFICAGFSFGRDTEFGPKLSRSRTQRNEQVRPCFGYRPHWVESTFDLTIANVKLEKILEFEALPLGYSFFLYDSDAFIFKHKLEHVCLAAPYSWERRGVNSFDLTLQLSRLAHYE